MRTRRASDLRQAILSSIPRDPWQLDEPEPHYVYVPKAHIRALDPDNMLVVGGRGTGKSFWWNALLSEAARSVVIPIVPALARTRLVTLPGWSPDNRPDLPEFPDKDTIAQIRTSGVPARTLWRTVFLAQVAPDFFHEDSTWSGKVEWMTENPEVVARALREQDAAYIARGEKALVLFDALDRTADDWSEIRELTRGLLQLVLDLRGTRALRAKAFVRSDMLEDSVLTAFPDASKVLSGKVELSWSRLDLYALLWQYMGNAPEGAEQFRGLFPGWTQDASVHRMPELLRSEELIQRSVFAAIAGEAMGASKKRGVPYTWIHTHLADAHGIVTPRSFLTALRTAAEKATSFDTLDVKSIHAGVQQASQIRVDELVREDYPWTQDAMEALEGLQVPCDASELEDRWASRDVPAKLSDRKDGRTTRHDLSKLDGLRGALVDIGVLEPRPDGRFNIPDVYRVGFRMKRKGGVKAVF
jgi:hypothetical protein